MRSIIGSRIHCQPFNTPLSWAQEIPISRYRSRQSIRGARRPTPAAPESGTPSLGSVEECRSLWQSLLLPPQIIRLSFASLPNFWSQISLNLFMCSNSESAKHANRNLFSVDSNGCANWQRLGTNGIRTAFCLMHFCVRVSPFTRLPHISQSFHTTI